MKKIVLSLVLIIFVLGSTAVYAGGFVGRITYIDRDTDRVFLCIDPDEPDRVLPSSGDLVFNIRSEDTELGYRGILEVLEYAHEHMDSYYCYISNGGYQSSGGYQSVDFAQLIPRTDSLREEIGRLTDEVAQLRNAVVSLRLYVWMLSRRMRR